MVWSERLVLGDLLLPLAVGLEELFARGLMLIVLEGPEAAERTRERICWRTSGGRSLVLAFLGGLRVVLTLLGLGSERLCELGTRDWLEGGCGGLRTWWLRLAVSWFLSK